VSEIPATDRVPTLEQLLKAPDIERILAPFLAWDIDGVALFERDGSPFMRCCSNENVLARWDMLPPEAMAALRAGSDTVFGVDTHRFFVRPAFAGASRVGTMVFCVQNGGRPFADGRAMVDALTGVVGSLLQSGFAAWVTSELHLAASESSFRALETRNTELRRAVEHLREVDMLKSNFLATVSHELRTPLTSVIGFSEMLLKGIAGDLNTEQDEYVTTILERGEELLRLITQILEMSQLEMGTLHICVRATSLVEIVQRVQSSVQIAAEKAEVVINHSLAASLPSVVVDTDKVQRVLVNLVANAVNFSPPGGTVTISARRAPMRRPFEEETFFGEETADALQVSVRDSGMGIPPEQLARVFEAFYQVDASSTRAHGGAGLGLSIVRKLIEAHGGEVWAESEVGIGTTFYFTLPLSAPEGARESDDGPARGYGVHSAESLSRGRFA